MLPQVNIMNAHADDIAKLVYDGMYQYVYTF